MDIDRAMTAVLLSFVGSLALSGCSDDDEPPALAVEPVFAVGLQVFGENLADGGTNYIGFVDGIEAGEVDLADAIEVPGAGGLWGLNGTGEFYLSNREDFSLTKYRIQEGRPEVVGRIGLGARVSPLFGEVLVFDGPSRGFLFVPFSGIALEIDLDLMEIVGTLDIASLVDPEMPTFGGVGIYSGSLYIFPIFATDQIEETVSESSHIVFFDPATGTVDARESPCGGLGYTMEADNGDIYLSTGPWLASINALDPQRAPDPCIVRVPNGSFEADADVIRLNDLTNAPTGGLVPRGGSSIYVRVLDTATSPPTDETTGAQLLGAPAWSTWEIDLEQPDTARPAERELVVGGISIFEVDGDFYENDSATDFSSTTLIRTTGPGAPAATLSSPGVPFAVVRLR